MSKDIEKIDEVVSDEVSTDEVISDEESTEVGSTNADELNEATQDYSVETAKSSTENIESSEIEEPSEEVKSEDPDEESKDIDTTSEKIDEVKTEAESINSDTTADKHILCVRGSKGALHLYSGELSMQHPVVAFCVGYIQPNETSIFNRVKVYKDVDCVDAIGWANIDELQIVE